MSRLRLQRVLGPTSTEACGFREPREGQERERHYLVLSRSCADLYEEIADLFADRPSIEVVVDRRRGLGRMAEIPAARKPRAERRRRRRQASMTLVLPKPAKEVQ